MGVVGGRGNKQVWQLGMAEQNGTSKRSSKLKANPSKNAANNTGRVGNGATQRRWGRQKVRTRKVENATRHNNGKGW